MATEEQRERWRSYKKQWRLQNQNNTEYISKKKAWGRKTYLKYRDSEEWKERNKQANVRWRLRGGRVDQSDRVLQKRAYCKVQRAINTGLLKRPKSCQRCGVIPRRSRSGQLLLHAHHEDYKKPLEVKWLCSTCYGKTRRIY